MFVINILKWIWRNTTAGFQPHNSFISQHLPADTLFIIIPLIWLSGGVTRRCLAASHLGVDVKAAKVQPGQERVGSATRPYRISVHRSDCPSSSVSRRSSPRGRGSWEAWTPRWSSWWLRHLLLRCSNTRREKWRRKKSYLTGLFVFFWFHSVSLSPFTITKRNQKFSSWCQWNCTILGTNLVKS